MLQLTLPDPDHLPPQPSEPAVDRPIPSPVSLNLRLPKSPVLLGQPETPGASVPETPVNEHRHLLLAEREVWPAGHHQMPSPTPYTSSSHQLRQSDLGLLVPLAPDPRHDLGTLGFRPDINHKARRVESSFRSV